MPILSKDSERREQYILHTMTKANKQNMAQKKGAALTNRALGLWYIHLKVAASGAKRDVISPLSDVPQDIRA